MPKIDLAAIPVRTGSFYPEPYASMMEGRASQRLGDAAGLTQFGANVTILAPGALSSMRHWHVYEDEFVVVTDGEVTLIEDNSETVLGPGDCAAFPLNVENGHHFVNRTDTEARFVVFGTKLREEIAYFSDVDMKVHYKDGRQQFLTRDGALLRETGH